ncbi:MAG: alpha/beta hydrolase family protein, partial [Gemmatimonadaceae bacterium]
MTMLMMHPRRSFRGPAFHVVGAIILAAVILGLLLLLWPKRAGAQTAAARSVVIVVLKGNDTLVVERIQRTARSVSAVIGGPGQPLLSLQHTLGADHRVPAMSFSVQGLNAPADAPPLQRGTLELAGDSAFLSIVAAGQTRNLRLGTKAGALPISNNDFVTMEQAIRVARAAKATSMDVPLFAMASGQTLQGRLELIGGDSARFGVAGSVTTMSIDADGNVTGGAIAAQGVRIVVLEGEAAARVSFGRMDYSAPAGAPYVAEEVTVKTPAGHSLSGTLTLPRAESTALGAGAAGAPKSRLPAIVTITGSGLQDRDEFIPVAGGFRLFRQVADTLSRRGIAVLRLDDRGIGGSGGDVNGTTADFADDIRAAVA